MFNTLREAVYRLRFSWQTKSFTVGLSIGLVAITQTSESLTELLTKTVGIIKLLSCFIPRLRRYLSLACLS